MQCRIKETVGKEGRRGGEGGGLVCKEEGKCEEVHVGQKMLGKCEQRRGGNGLFGALRETDLIIAVFN